MKLAKIPTVGDSGLSKSEIKQANKQLSKEIEEYQNKLMADGSQSLLVIFQGVDASGKDGALKDVFRNINPAGCNVWSFKKPTEREMRHDFLWRVHQVCPAAGMIQIFNRSHYEDILVPSVEKFIPKDIIDERFDIINNFERTLEANGTKILKFYLHISKEVQEEKLKDRINLPEKHWKHNDGDWAVREKWDEYMEVYEDIFKKCNIIPWHIIPSDDNKEKANAISKIVLQTFEDMHLSYPDLESKLFTPEYEK